MKNPNSTTGLGVAVVPALKKGEPGIMRAMPTEAVLDLYEELIKRLFDKKKSRQTSILKFSSLFMTSLPDW